jgi:hypothetical protein
MPSLNVGPGGQASRSSQCRLAARNGCSATPTTSSASPPPASRPTRPCGINKLATLPGVQKLTSTIVMKRIVDDRPYPPPRAPAEGTRHRA